MTRRLMASAAVVFAMTVLLAAQGGGRPASPAGSSATQVGARSGGSTPSYQAAYRTAD